MIGPTEAAVMSLRHDNSTTTGNIGIALDNNKVCMKIELDNKDCMPKYATDGSACMDIKSSEDVVIKPGETKLISTGIYSEFPAGHVALIFSRSGLSINHGGALANCVGVIDSDYRGEWKIGLYNRNKKKLFSNKNDITIHKGDRIAQFMILPFPKINIVLTYELNSTKRGTTGFGSTGMR